MSIKRDVKGILAQLQDCADARQEAIADCIHIVEVYKQKWTDEERKVSSVTANFLSVQLKKLMKGYMD